MPSRSFQKGGERQVEVSLPTRQLDLDVSQDRSSLREGQASIVVGRDILTKGRMGIHPGRRPVAIDSSAILPGDYPLTTALPSYMHGKMVRIYSAHSGVWDGKATTADFENLSLVANDTVSPRMTLTEVGLENFGPFIPEMDGGLVFSRSQTINAAPKRVRFVDSSTLEFYNFEFERTGAFVESHIDGFLKYFTGSSGQEKKNFYFSIRYNRIHDKRGMWVSNGQKFWLLRDGVYTKYLDLGDSSETKGLRWNGKQLSPTVFVFVAANQIPRVITLSSQPFDDSMFESPDRIDLETTLSLSGMLPPDLGGRTNSFQTIYMNNLGDEWINDALSSDSDNDNEGVDVPADGEPANKYRVRVRVIDELTGAVSRFFELSPIGHSEHSILGRYIPVTFGGGANILVENESFVWHSQTTNPNEGIRHWPFRNMRATHIEIWRTTANTNNYFLEYVKPISWSTTNWRGVDGVLFKFHNNDYSLRLDRNANVLTSGLPTKVFAALNKPDSRLILGIGLDDVSRRTGGLPPVSREVVTVGGMSVFGGSSDTDVVLSLQDKELLWPSVIADEVIHHSEILSGRVLPESFHPSDFRRLSRIGDRLQRLIEAGDIALAVMREGVHRIERVPDTSDPLSGLFLTAFDIENLKARQLRTKSIAERGAGTPWPDTVLSIEREAVWATPSGIRTYDPDADQGEGRLSFVETAGMREWFADAMRFGLDVEAGFDQRYGMLHFRRHFASTLPPAGSIAGSPEAGIVQTQSPPPSTVAVPGETRWLAGAAAINLKTGEWSLYDDHVGFRYVSAINVEATTNESVIPTLYSVTEKGQLFEENYTGDVHPYDGYAVEGVIDNELSGGFYQTPGFLGAIFSATEEFVSIMAGDVIRFYHPDFPEIDRQARLIRETDIQVLGWELSSFETDPTRILPLGTRFTIGATRYKIRYAPITGSSNATVKTVIGASVVARPGRRHRVNPAWSENPLPISVRVYRNFGESAVDEKIDEVQVYDETDTDRVSQDRESAVDAQGEAIEFEIESIHARSNFTLDAVTVRINEESDQVQDVSTET